MKLPFDFGEYVLEELIGWGGMGDVYLSRRKRDEVQFAIKTVHPHLIELKNFIRRFHREAKLLEKLAHPRVVRLYENGVFEIEGEKPVHYIVMEYVTGSKLTDIINGEHTGMETSRMTLNVKLDGQDKVVVVSGGVIHVLRQIAAVLQEAHQLGIVHRDIKPDNIMITNPGWDVKLLDFGLARDSRELQLSISQSGHVIGTPPYMSPEQCAGDTEIDIRSDLYALGVVAYECLTGVLPFAGPTTMAFIQQHINMKPHPLRELNSVLPEGISLVVWRMLAKEKSLRHQTPAELIEDLNRIERGWLPLKIYSFERGTLTDAPARGGAIISGKQVGREVLKSDPAQSTQEKPAPLGPEKSVASTETTWKKRSLIPLLLAALLLLGAAVYFLAPVFLADETRWPPAEEIAVPAEPDSKDDPEKELLEEFDSLVGHGKSALEEERIEEAIEHIESALELKEDREARELLAEAVSALEARKAQEYKRREFATLVAQGDSLFESGDWTGAVMAYEAALKLFRDDAVADKLIAAKGERLKAERKREHERLAESEEREKRRDQIQEKLVGLMKMARDSLQQDNWALAKSEYLEASGLAVELGDEATIEFIGKELELLEQLCSLDKIAAGAGESFDFRKEAEALKEIIKLSDAEGAKSRLSKVRGFIELESAMRLAEEKEDWRALKNAAGKLALTGHPAAREALNKAELEIEYEYLLENVFRCKDSEEYLLALAYIMEAKQLKDDDELDEIENLIREKLRLREINRNFNLNIEKAQTAVDENRPYEALKYARKAVSLMPGESRSLDLLRKVENICRKKTVSLELQKSFMENLKKPASAIARLGDVIYVSQGPGGDAPESTSSIWKIDSGEAVELVPEAHQSAVSCLRVSDDRIYSGSLDGTVRRWKPEGEPEGEIGFQEPVLSLAVYGRYAVCALKSGILAVVDIEKFEEVKKIEIGEGLRDVALSKDGDSVFALSSGMITKYSLIDLERKARYESENPLTTMILLGDRLAAGDDSGKIHILDTENLETDRKIESHEGGITALSHCSGCSILSCAAIDGSIRFLNSKTMEELGASETNCLMIRGVRILADKVYAASEVSGLAVLEPGN